MRAVVLVLGFKKAQVCLSILTPLRLLECGVSGEKNQNSFFLEFPSWSGKDEVWKPF